MSEKVKEMLKTALEMERKGKEFYEQTIEKCSNEPGREIFTTLMKDEVIHIDRIKSIYTSLESGEGWNPGWEDFKEDHGSLNVIFGDLANKYGKNIKAETSDIEALDVGIDFEDKSVKFYEDALKNAGDDLEKTFVNRMIVEEKGHYAVLTDLKFYLTNPEGWFQENEHHGMDGA